MKFIALTIITLLLIGCDFTATETPELPTTEVTLKTLEHGYSETYSAAKLDEQKQSGNPFVVFVGADWCPGCVKLEAEIQANEHLLPKDHVILLADFDEDTQLHQPYEVTTKHTGIFFDAAGNHVTTLAGVTFEDFTTHFDRYQ